MLYRAKAAVSGNVLAERLRPAHTHWTRLKGLLGTKSLLPGDGLWLKPCKQVHMFGMMYPLDLVFLDRNCRVVHTISGLHRNTISPKISGAESVLELPVGTIARAELTLGCLIIIELTAEASALSVQVDSARSFPDPDSSKKMRNSIDRERLLDGIAAGMCNVALAALYAVFGAAHFSRAQQSGEWLTTMPIVVQEALLVLLFLTRQRSMSTSRRLRDWAIGIAGTFLPMLLRPTQADGALDWLGQPLQALGLSFAIAGLVCLGRSVGVVAANRGIKTNGLYRLVRHPMYAAYILTYVGYLASYPSARNWLLVVLTVLALNFRAIVEEHFLEQDPTYSNYLHVVRWRFVPFVY